MSFWCSNSFLSLDRLLNEFRQLIWICDMSSSRSTQSTRSQDNPIYCHCNMQCQIYTCYKANNRGRKFYRCPRNRSEDDCRYFRWIDEENCEVEDINRFRSANASEVHLKHAGSVIAELLQIKVLMVIMILLVGVAIHYMSKPCDGDMVDIKNSSGMLRYGNKNNHKTKRIDVVPRSRRASLIVKVIHTLCKPHKFPPLHNPRKSFLEGGGKLLSVPLGLIIEIGIERIKIKQGIKGVFMLKFFHHPKKCSHTVPHPPFIAWHSVVCHIHRSRSAIWTRASASLQFRVQLSPVIRM
ncbi:hypothetical protein IEQ34_006163 [Dendrobium chrysotoxum]|uniref:GRF-type domain-containing protein n=1 Tax=Dendrobium chrysotoxum TaxID=161865 RepID=A0AAV7HD46_DENCH|nr:hypothetical protein IEQ34_006163 [Dendrobium chrysotoxum]